MENNPYLTPWIIPRWAIEGFCDEVKYGEVTAGDFFITQIIEHSPTQYLVITGGSDHREIIESLQGYIADLFRVEENNEQTTEV